jgi:hypothetical protein
MPLQVGWLQPEGISPVAVFLAPDTAALVIGAEFAAAGETQPRSANRVCCSGEHRRHVPLEQRCGDAADVGNGSVAFFER